MLFAEYRLLTIGVWSVTYTVVARICFTRVLIKHPRTWLRPWGNRYQLTQCYARHANRLNNVDPVLRKQV